MQLSETSLDMPHQSLALGRQADTTAFALEQHGSEILFKASDGMTDRTGRQAEVISRQAKRSGTCRRLKGAQSGQVKIAKGMWREWPLMQSPSKLLLLLTCPRIVPDDGSKAEKLKASKCFLLFPQQRT